jgi:tRNA threonylcarbamoyladenosine biosynthesis protein TsaE
VRQSTATSLRLADAEGTRRVGSAIGDALASETSAGAVIWLEGELGAGKTTLVAGILARFGVRGPIRSPTYTLVEPYDIAARTLHHIDLYRLVDPRELEALAVREMLSEGDVLLIEWPSRASAAVPAADLQIEMHYEDGGGRTLQATAYTERGDKLLRAIVAANPEKGGVSP